MRCRVRAVKKPCCEGGVARRARGIAAGWLGGGAAGRAGRRHTLNKADANDAAVVSRERALTLPVAALRCARTAHAPHANATVVGTCRRKPSDR